MLRCLCGPPSIPLSFILAALFDNAAGNDHLKESALVLLVVREGHPLALGVLIIMYSKRYLFSCKWYVTCKD